MPQELGTNGTWFHPKTVPVIKDEETPDLAMKATHWHGNGVKDLALDRALDHIEDLPVETRAAISNLVDAVTHDMWLIVNAESERRDREWARVMLHMLTKANKGGSLDDAVSMVTLCAKSNFEGSMEDQVQHFMRQHIKAHFERITAALDVRFEDTHS